MLRAVVVFLMCILLSSAAFAEKRIALLIGNQGYSTEIGRLANPHNDVALLEAALKGLGFEVVTVRDAGQTALTRAVNSYARRVQAAGPNAVGFFYYSGHGAADGQTNYLIPVDVSTTETGELWDQSLRLTEVTRKLKTEAGNATHFVVFDACRNTLKLTKAGSRALVQSKGFVPVSQESGMLIAYATAEGELASDVGAGAGPYAKVLAEEIVKPGVEAVSMFRRVQVRVRSTIGQEPWLGFTALNEVHLAGAEVPPISAASTPQIAELLATCVTDQRHPLGSQIVERLAAIYGKGNLHHRWKRKLDGATEEETLVARITEAKIQASELHLSYDYDGGRLVLVPTVTKGYSRSAPPGSYLQGLWMTK